MVPPQGMSVPEAGQPRETPAARAPSSPASSSPAINPAAPRMLTAYYVLLDDGGSSGVRFGCNDSLVGLARPVPGSEPLLTAAMNALLEGAGAADTPLDSIEVADVYNALDNSDLTFLSGSFDGTTVTVYLAGTLSLGGACDTPRVEAQLTQTAVAAVGAIRAEVYVNGQPLTEVLRQD